ncbi:MAG: sulfite exporter TauE/SafE family protein [Candidatus Bathyarchaeota archaeon]|nr:sulfite exporter TauE/SafE family protein [Candidatus Bathyarchaeota archaeon]
MIGVGGGEFRIPILIYVLGLPVFNAVAINLSVGLLTVVASFFRRLHIEPLGMHCLSLVLIMSFASVVGAIIGASLTGRIPEKPLKKFLILFLISVGLKIGLEPFVKIDPVIGFTLNFFEELALAGLVGLLIGIISGLFGVAGGEFRIPVFIYIFGLDIVTAGTASLLVSIPTVASGFLRHRRLGNFDGTSLRIPIILGLSSVFGALCGASFLEVVGKETLKVLLAFILILATVRMITKP